MSPRKLFAVFGTLLVIGLIFNALPVLAQYPGSGQVPLDPMAVPKFVDPLPHFAGARVDATALGTPLMVEIMSLNQQALSTGTVLPNGTVVGGGAGLTHVWGYRISNGAVTQGPLWPGFTVEAMRGVPLDVMYLNNLNESYDAVNLATDQTLHWALGTYSMDNYTGPVPIVSHLHGGEVPAWSDGGPDAWYTPLGAAGGHAALTNVYHYPNTQEAATLWFHDHALGATRLNVYAGLAAFYFLRDAGEDGLMLPGWSGDGMVQEVDPVTGALGNGPYLPEIEVAIQDRMFDQNGQLYFPAAPFTPNPTIHPFWVPEFEGDIMTVNGKTWPYLSVAPRKYRFRFLNGSNARFYVLNLGDGPLWYQVGTDGGLLDAPVALNQLTLGPGERADIIIDFTGLGGNSYVMKNTGRTPFPKGPPPKGSTIGQIMKFVVNGQMVGADNSVVTGRAMPLEKLSNFPAATLAAGVTPVRNRQLTLNEVIGAGGPLEALVNNTKWGGASARPYGDFTAVDASGTLYSEIITEGDTEVWKIINITGDAHPIHLHLVQFQLISRQKFNVNKYTGAYAAAFPGGVVLEAWGPPMDYNVNQTPAAAIPTIGGNPDVTPYLQGPAKPAEPNERGWKDTFIMYPGEVTTVVARWAPQDAGATGNNYFDFNPNGGHGYVWHCHIIDHEDNEMMRPYTVIATGPAGRINGPLYPGYQNVHPNAVAMAFQGAGAQMNTSNMPESYALEQNYPNPFNPTTQIRFAMPEEGAVKLEVYNVKGQVVATLIDGVAPAGEHTVRLDATGLSSGVYFYRLTAGNFTQTKKMTLMK
jgi:spore coat protein A